MPDEGRRSIPWEDFIESIPRITRDSVVGRRYGEEVI